MIFENFIQQYNLGKILSIKTDSVGSGNNYIVETESGKYFAKFFKNDDALNFPEREIKVVNCLREKKVPVAEFVLNKHNEYLTKIDNESGHLQRFLKGITYINNNLPDNILMESAQILGNIHSCLYPHTDNNDNCFLKKISLIQNNLRELQKISEIIKEKKIETNLRIEKELDYRIHLLERYTKADLENIFKEFTFGLTHGDYNCRQLLVDKGKISTVLDFSRASNRPYIWEIVRSYTIGSKKCRNGEIDFIDFEKYMEEYSSRFKLKKFDINYAWEMYKIQLAGSPFGYYEYVYKNDPGVLAFATWRTKIIKAIENQVDLLRLI